MIVKFNNTIGLYNKENEYKPFIINGITLGQIEKIDKGIIYVNLFTDCDLELDFTGINFYNPTPISNLIK